MTLPKGRSPAEGVETDGRSASAGALRAAAIDIGTNSVLLLVAERRGAEVIALRERSTITRLGQGVDKTRALHPDAVRRTLDCLEAYAEDIRALDVTLVDAVGTSAMRDANGGPELAERARALLGVAPRTISGAEEARLTFRGALSGLALDTPRAVVVDIGGGSTEIIERGAGSASAPRGVSLDIGSVRLTERHVRSNPPPKDELESVRADARRALATLRGIEPGATIVGVAGTVTTLAAFALGVAPYDAARIHGAKLSAAQVRSASEELARMTLEERRKLPTVKPERADVIVAGALILEEVLAWAGAPDLLVSDRGVRWGLAAELLAS